MKKSVIVPVYNEEGNIGNLILKIKTVLNNNDELIIVNDAGHSMSEKGITIKLLDSVERLESF